MNFKIKTKVPGDFKTIMAAFDLRLFEALAPKHADMEIVEFSGSKKGDIVHLRFKSPIKAEWVSEIIEHGESESESYFIDEGVKLPFGLRYWQHKHIVRKAGEGYSEIVDDISFRSFNGFFTLLLLPVLYVGFYPRRSVYKNYFSALMEKQA